MSDCNSVKGRLLVVGNAQTIHLGSHFKHAACNLALDYHLLDTNRGLTGPSWLLKFNWHLRGRRPTRLRSFSDEVVEACTDFRPSWMISTGIAPIEAGALKRIKQLGTKLLNYLTDDPWNPAHQAPWFMKALPLYDHVFSPRCSNLDDLVRLGCAKVSYLPFAYAPELHFPGQPTSASEQERFAADVVFAGGADRDRISVMSLLARCGFNIALYGGYWERYPETRTWGRGHADPETLRKAIGGARVALCLVRRANRDGHSMRSFEIPAIGACILTEDTGEHREIFGSEGEAVVYFRGTDEMVEKLRWLLAHDDERERLALAAHSLITRGCNTYKDRLLSMLGLADGEE